MGGVVDAVVGAGGDIIDAGGDAIGGLVDTAGDVVSAAGDVVSNTIQNAIDDPIGTAVKVAAVATGNAELLPAISAGDVIAHGGNLEQAATAAGMTAAAQGIVSYASDYYNAPPAPTTPTPAPTYDWYDDYSPPAPTPPPAPTTPLPAQTVVTGASAPDNIDVGGGWNPATGTSEPPVSTTYTPGSGTDMGEITTTAPRVDTTDYAGTVTPPPVTPGDVPVTDAVPSIVNPDPAVTTITGIADAVLPYIPAIIPTNPVVPTGPTQPPLTPLPDTKWGATGGLVNPGLNPGFITDVPDQYNATSPVQAQYYWGGHPYQTGTTFNRDLYKQVPADAQPWGLQQTYTPTDINAYLQQLGIGPIAPKNGA